MDKPREDGNRMKTRECEKEDNTEDESSSPDYTFIRDEMLTQTSPMHKKNYKFKWILTLLLFVTVVLPPRKEERGGAGRLLLATFVAI